MRDYVLAAVMYMLFLVYMALFMFTCAAMTDAALGAEPPAGTYLGKVGHADAFAVNRPLGSCLVVISDGPMGSNIVALACP